MVWRDRGVISVRARDAACVGVTSNWHEHVTLSRTAQVVQEGRGWEPSSLAAAAAELCRGANRRTRTIIGRYRYIPRPGPEATDVTPSGLEIEEQLGLRYQLHLPATKTGWSLVSHRCH